VGVGHVRCELQCLLLLADRFVETSCRNERDAEIMVRVRLSRLEPNRGFELLDGIVDSPFATE
jgi:hypothetical protein